jgi:hypothetical protein
MSEYGKALSDSGNKLKWPIHGRQIPPWHPPATSCHSPTGACQIATASCNFLAQTEPQVRFRHAVTATTGCVAHPVFPNKERIHAKETINAPEDRHRP